MPSIYTIGFTKKSARQFFDILQKNKIEVVVDVRLNNSGQLAGFTKKEDLQFFLSLVNIGYEHWNGFAPTKEMRKDYHQEWIWAEYENQYKKLIEERGILHHFDTQYVINHKLCLLCSEPTAEKCHRRIAAELIAQVIGKLAIVHL